MRYRELLELVNWQKELSSELETAVKQRNSAGWFTLHGLFHFSVQPFPFMYVSGLVVLHSFRSSDTNNSTKPA